VAGYAVAFGTAAGLRVDERAIPVRLAGPNRAQAGRGAERDRVDGHQQHDRAEGEEEREPVGRDQTDRVGARVNLTRPAVGRRPQSWLAQAEDGFGERSERAPREAALAASSASFNNRSTSR